MDSKATAGRGQASWLLILPLVLVLVPFFIVPIIGVTLLQATGTLLVGASGYLLLAAILTVGSGGRPPSPETTGLLIVTMAMAS